MSGDDFSDPTVLVPTPGGRRQRRDERGAGDDTFRFEPDEGAASLPDFSGVSHSPLVNAAAPLLALATRLQTAEPAGDVATLRERAIAEIHRFEERLARLEQPKEVTKVAHYAVCATIDDLVLNTPWGASSVWAHQSLVATFHRDTWGGERFYELLGRMQTNPGRFAEVLELMYICLSLGFEGKLRLDAQGPARHQTLRAGLHKLLGRERTLPGELSPHWKGVSAPHRPHQSRLPVWLVAAAAGVLLLFAFMGFSYLLNDLSDRSAAALAALPPTAPVSLARPAPPPPPPPPPPQVVQDTAPLPRITGFLEAEIAERLVTVHEDANKITVRIRNTGMFDSASATVNQRYLPVIQRISDALDPEEGAIVITGHSDSVPIRTLRFPSNWHLSQARAESVAEIVRPRLRDASRLTVEGLADTEPLASNDTAEGREQNRRIEVLLMKVDEHAL